MKTLKTLKHIALLVEILLMSFMGVGQISSYPYFCGFEIESDWDGWQIIDYDGDGNEWGWYSGAPHSGDGFALSYSYYNSKDLNPDNGLATPWLQIPVNGSCILSYWIKRQCSGWYDYYKIYIKEEGDIFRSITTRITAEYNYTEHLIDLSEYRGLTIKVMFDHELTDDGCALLLDDIMVTWDNPLPISLLSFTASPRPEYNLIQWTTATEKNNDLFILERSEDAIVFDEVYNVSGAGNSLEPLDYDFKDYQPASDITYYRLTQVDYDGSKTTSEIVSCIRTSEKMSNWEYFTRYDNLLQVHSSDKVLTIVCSDLLGRTIWQGKLLPHDVSELNLQTPYMVHIYEDNVLVGSEKVLW